MTDTSKQKFDPVQEFITIRDSLTRTLGQSLKLASVERNSFPAVNVYETEDAVIVRTQALEGSSASSLEVAVEDGVLSISGEVAPDEPDNTPVNYVIQEIPVGTFLRQITLPLAVIAEDAEATLKQGVLRIRLPKQ